MKRILSIVLSIIMIVSFCACGKAPVELITKKELIELDVAVLGDVSLSSFDSNGRYSALLYTEFIEEYPEAEDDFAFDISFYLSLFDIKRNREIKRIELKNDNNAYEVGVNDSGVSLYNVLNDEVISYDFKLENRTVGSYDYQDYYENAKNIPSIDADRFNCQDGFVISSNFGNNQALMFYDEADKFYMLKTNIYYEYSRMNNHNMLVIDNSANQTDKPESVVRIFDFNNQEEINSIVIPNSLDYNNIQFSRLNDSYASISTVKENGSLDKAYVWDYAQNAEKTPFEKGYCEVINCNEIDLKMDEACHRIKNNSGVSVECPSDKKFISEQYAVSNDIKPIDFYLSLLDIEYYLSLLPSEVYQEILCKDIENPVSSFDDFRIYLVGDFPEDDVDAFENNICSDETDNQHIVYIAYSCRDLIQKTFFHELMHAFEYRIWNYEEDFDEKWMKLNPIEFDYTDDYSNCYYEEGHEDWQSFFARDYGMKNILEDRATCFEELCDGALSDSCWWKDIPELSAKQRYLAKALEKSFPSLSDGSIWKNALDRQ